MGWHAVKMNQVLVLRHPVYYWYSQKESALLVGFFVQWHIDLRGLFNAEAILVEKLK